MAAGRDERVPASGSRSVERAFAALGLAAAALAAVAAVLAVDVWLPGGEVGADDEQATGVFAMRLVTRDGRRLGGPDIGIELVLWPLGFYENRPDQVATKESLHVPVTYRINAAGMRGLEPERPARRPRVIFVGGSAAFGLRVPEEDTFVARLQRRLPGVEFLNAGVVGYLSSQELALSLHRLLEFAPDLIVAFDGWNDLYDNYWWAVTTGERGAPLAANSGFRVLENRLVAYRRIESEREAALGAAWHTLRRHSAILSTLAGWLRRDPPRLPVLAFDEPWLEAVVAQYAANLAKLGEVARAGGGRLLVVLQPELGQVLGAHLPAYLAKRSGRPDLVRGDRYWIHFPGLYAQFRRAAEGRLAEAGVEVLDASPMLAAGGGLESIRFFLDPVHLSPIGHEKLADALASRLERP